jgi:hypothetical protein
VIILDALNVDGVMKMRDLLILARIWNYIMFYIMHMVVQMKLII